MPEHVYLLLRPAETLTVARLLRTVKVGVAKRVINRWRELNTPVLASLRFGDTFRFWQPGGGFDRNVRDEEAFSREVRYIHHNPVKRGLAASPDLWKWSGARSWMGLDTSWPHDAPPGDPRPWGERKGFV